MDQKYYGWNNRQTSIVNLWLSDEEMYRTIQTLVESALLSDYPKYTLAKSLQAYVEARVDNYVEARVDKGHSFQDRFVTDLIYASVAMIDWQELSLAYIDDAKREKAKQAKQVFSFGAGSYSASSEAVYNYTIDPDDL